MLRRKVVYVRQSYLYNWKKHIQYMCSKLDLAIVNPTGKVSDKMMTLWRSLAYSSVRMSKEGNSHFGIFHVRACKKCGTSHIQEANIVKYTCDVCADIQYNVYNIFICSPYFIPGLLERESQ